MLWRKIDVFSTGDSDFLNNLAISFSCVTLVLWLLLDNHMMTWIYYYKTKTTYTYVLWYYIFIHSKHRIVLLPLKQILRWLQHAILPFPIDAILTLPNGGPFHTIQYSLVFIIIISWWHGNIFRVSGHLCGDFTGPRWIPHTKANDAELWYFFNCVWINGCINNGGAGDLIRYRAHYDVYVIWYPCHCPYIILFYQSCPTYIRIFSI